MIVWVVIFGSVDEPIEHVAVYSTEEQAVTSAETYGSNTIWQVVMDAEVAKWLQEKAAFIEQYRREHA